MKKTAIVVLVSLASGSGAEAQTRLHRFPGPDLGSRMGNAVAGVGDIDGDGHDDLMIGAPNYAFDWGGQVGPGLVSVRSGRTGATLFRFVGGAYGNPYIGSTVARGGDMDGDGVLDVLYAGSSSGYSAASVSVHSGLTGDLLYKKKGSYLKTPELGRGLVGGVDLDLDGFDDFVATAPFGISSGSGELFAYSGADGTLLYSLQGGPNAGGFGSGLACLGDLDGDAVPELVVGAQGAGLAEVRSGADGALLYTVNGSFSFGFAVAGLGDVDADGWDDFAVGGFRVNAEEGRAYVYSGVDGSLVHELYGSHPDARFGFSVAGVGDWNGDGTPDVAVGAPFDDELFKNSGRVTLFSGATGRELMVLYGNKAGAELGLSVGGAGDVDGGGVPDLIAGAPGSGVMQVPGGEAVVWAGERSAGVYCTAKASSLGCTPTIWSSGVPALSASSFRINAYSVPNERSGALYWGLRPAGVPWSGGFECVDAIQGRRSVTSGGNPSAVFPQPDCSGSFRSAWSGAFMSAAGLVPGQSVYVQFWYTDPGDPTGVGLTDALRFDVLP